MTIFTKNSATELAYETLQAALFSERGELSEAAREAGAELEQVWDEAKTVVTFPDGSQITFAFYGVTLT